MGKPMETWTCGKCGRVFSIPDGWHNQDGYSDAIMRVREHRFGHLVEQLENATDEEIWGMSGDAKPKRDWFTPEAAVVEADRIVREAQKA